MNPAHYDHDTLADLAEGLLEEDRAASVAAHLDLCAECQERSADLADVSRILAEAPVPSMPAELASRIDSAIAAESLNSATVVSLERRRGRRPWRILSAAAATVVVLGGGALVAGQVLNGSGASDTASSAKPPMSDPEVRSEGGGSAPKDPSRSKMAEVPGAARGDRFEVSRSGTDYRAPTLGRQVNGALDANTQQRSGGTQPDQRMTGCVIGVTNGKNPTLVDSSTYEGTPATVIAAPGATLNTLDVWVVGPDCSAQNPSLLKHMTTPRD
jgi:hypothetical protein